ncbi:MAG: diguanylate cyclase, partial [Ktedonobacteraceae bacterium]
LINKQLEQQVITDSLTGLPNHQALIDRLDTELVRTKAQQITCSILFIDVDHFKPVNDTYGHPVGDMVLCQFGDLVESTLHSTDYLGRWGGEEFLAVLPGTNGNDALAVAERIRLRVARHIFSHNNRGLRLTCSLGSATYPTDANKREILVMLADTAMYAAKHLGRNQTRTAHEPSVLALGRTVEAPQALAERKVQGIVEALIALQEGRDHPTSQHERRVAILTRQLALSMGLSEEEAYIAYLGGLLHDLGKVALPDTLLLKRGRLTEEEFSTIRVHPVTGAHVLSTVPALHEVASIVHSHHEWMNGSGYPDKLVGEAIPLAARIVAVVDAYDVITHNRPYQLAHSATEALQALQKNAGPQFDPRVVAALIHLLANSPPQQIEVFH